MRNKKNTKNTEINILELNELLDKMLELQASSKSPSFLKKTIYIVTSICVIMLVGLICCTLYKNNFSTESILSTFLAFFSIFISIFFYFKADETSTRFYDSSYKFMKEISVTLGKIEERFGEKLNNLDDKISHLDHVSKEASDEIEDKKEIIDTINELLQGAQLNEDKKEQYLKQIEEKENEIEVLKRSKFFAQKEANRLRQIIEENRETPVNSPYRIPTTSRNLLIEMLVNEKVPDHITDRRRFLLKRDGFIDSDGNINKHLILDTLEKQIS